MPKTCLVAALAASLSMIARAGVKFERYDVHGASAAELRASLDANSPIVKDGKKYDGHTTWHVSWTYRYTPIPSGCQLTEVRATVDGIIVLPRWINSDDASSALVKQWQDYLSALRTHEYGHYSHGRKAAEEIEALGRSFRTSGNCSTIGNEFNDYANYIIEKYTDEDRGYDARTNHGRNQGVKFPQ